MASNQEAAVRLPRVCSGFAFEWVTGEVSDCFREWPSVRNRSRKPQRQSEILLPRFSGVRFSGEWVEDLIFAEDREREVWKGLWRQVSVRFRFSGW